MSFGKKIKIFIKRNSKKKVSFLLALVLAINSILIISLAQFYFYKSKIDSLSWAKNKAEEELNNTPEKKAENLKKEVFPEEEFATNIKWGDLGKKLVDIGVIDKEKFLKLFANSPEKDEYKNILEGEGDDYIKISHSDSRFVLDILWAAGLAQKSKILSEGAMFSYSGDPSVFASTGGWNLGNNDAMEFYSKHNLFDLNSDQEKLIEKIASMIYRPCCNNSTAFPDCNHGMAMLGLIEILVFNGESEENIYKAALKFNSYWFPENYITIASFMKEKKNLDWDKVSAKEILGKEFSSSSGYANIKKQVQVAPSSIGSGGCAT